MAREMKALQMQLFSDDSSEGVFEDGSKLELSSCGSVFLYSKGASVSGPVLQQTRFALSAYKAAMDELIKFRNTWAEKAFICTVVGETKVKDLQWPCGENVHHFLHATQNGDRRSRSVDGSGYVELHGHKQTCDVSFSVETTRESRPCQHSLSAGQQGTKYKGGAKVDVCVIVQRYSVAAAMAAPGGVYQWWHYPLSVLLGAVPSAAPPTSGITQPGVVHGLCARPQLHRWTTTQGDGKAVGPQEAKVLKVLWTSEGFTYRLHYSPQVCLEIYCTDGTFARSHDSSGRYFTCWSPSNKDTSTVIWNERVYSAEHPPPLVGGSQGLSLARALGRGERLLYTASQLRDAATYVACWNSKEDLTLFTIPSAHTTAASSLHPSHLTLSTADSPTVPPMSTSRSCVSAEQDVDGVGCFKVYESGRVVVHYQDTTHLETYLSAMDRQHRGYVRGGEGEKRLEGTCWIRLRSGRTETVPLNFKGSRYVATAREWCEWLCSSPETRGLYFRPVSSQQVSPALCQSSVRQELRKINSVLYGQGDPPSEQAVTRALEQTRHALRDLGAVINSNSAIARKQ